MSFALSSLRPSALTVVFLGFATLVSSGAARSTADRTLDGTVAASIRTVRIDHRSGPVRITGVDADFGWSWKLVCEADGEGEAAARLKECDLIVKESGNSLELELVVPENRHRHSTFSGAILGFLSWNFSHGLSTRSELELRLPKAVALELRNRFGSSHVTVLNGSVRVDCDHGQVELSELSGAVTARTSFATLRARNLGSATLRNRNGSVEIDGIGGELRAETSFSSLQASRVHGRAELKNQNGAIEAAGIDADLVAATSFARLRVRDIKGSADLKNQHGGIDVRNVGHDVTAASSFSEVRAEDIGGKASLSCRNGRIEARNVGEDLRAANSFGSLQVRGVHGEADLASQNGEIAASEVEGNIRARTSFAKMVLDGGGRRFDAQNQNGSVSIVARSPQLERIAATASFAPIDVRLAGGVRPVVRAQTSFGKVRSDFPVVLADSSGDDGRDGAGNQPKINLSGQNGDIRIQRIDGR